MACFSSVPYEAKDCITVGRNFSPWLEEHGFFWWALVCRVIDFPDAGPGAGFIEVPLR